MRHRPSRLVTPSLATFTTIRVTFLKPTIYSLETSSLATASRRLRSRRLQQPSFWLTYTILQRGSLFIILNLISCHFTAAAVYSICPWPNICITRHQFSQETHMCPCTLLPSDGNRHRSFQLSTECRTFPSQWTTAWTNPINKLGTGCLCHYRPVYCIPMV